MTPAALHTAAVVANYQQAGAEQHANKIMFTAPNSNVRRSQKSSRRELNTVRNNIKAAAKQAQATTFINGGGRVEHVGETGCVLFQREKPRD